MMHPRPEQGRMTRAMRAVRPQHPFVSTQAQLAVRVAVIREGVITSERLFTGGHVDVGTSLECGVVLVEGPTKHRLFERHRDGYQLRPWPGLRCRVDGDEGEASADPKRATVLGANSRGTLASGETRLLFHVLPAPAPHPRASLPAGVERGVFASIDWLTTVIAAFSFLLHFFAVTLVYSDWMDPVIDDHAVVSHLVETSKRIHVPPPLSQPVVAPSPTGAATADAKAAASASSATRAGAKAPGRGQGRMTTGSGRSAERSADMRAEQLGEALDALGIRTLTALDRAGPATTHVMDAGDVPVRALEAAAASRMGAEEESDLRLSGGAQSKNFEPGAEGRRPGPTRNGSEGGDAAQAGEEKKVAGPTISSSTSGGDTSQGGKNIPGASSVVARMRSRFRGCYRAGLDQNPTLQGSTTLVASIAANGSVSSVGGGGGALAAITPCLKAVVRGAQFTAPRDGRGVVSISVNFLLTQ